MEKGVKKGSKGSDINIIDGDDHKFLDDHKDRSRSKILHRSGHLSLSMASRTSNHFNDFILKDLKYLDKEFTFSQIPVYVWHFIKIIWPSLILCGDFIVDSILNSIGFYFCNKSADEAVEAAFGLSLFVCLFFIVGIAIAIIEKTAINCSILFGTKDYHNTKRIIYQGIMTTLFEYTIFFLIFYFFLDDYLVFAGFEHRICELCGEYFRRLFWIYVMYCMITQIKAFTASQGREEALMWMTVFNVLLGGVLIWLFCWYLDRGLQGWFEANTIHKLWEVISYTILCINVVDQRTIGRISTSDLFVNYSYFVKDTLVFVVGSYSEQISFEISTFLVSLTRNTSQIAAQTAFVNAAYYIYELGLGFDITGRTRFTHLMAKGKKMAAKRFFYQMFSGLMTLGIGIGIALFYSRPLLTKVYSSNMPEVDFYFLRLVAVCSFFCWTEFTFSFIYTVARCLGWVGFLAWMNIIVLVLMQLISGLIIVLYYGQSCVEVMVNLYVLEIGLLLIVLYRIFTLDWQNAKLIEDHEDVEVSGPLLNEHEKRELSKIYESSKRSIHEGMKNSDSENELNEMKKKAEGLRKSKDNNLKPSNLQKAN